MLGSRRGSGFQITPHLKNSNIEFALNIFPKHIVLTTSLHGKENNPLYPLLEFLPESAHEVDLSHLLRCIGCFFSNTLYIEMLTVITYLRTVLSHDPLLFDWGPPGDKTNLRVILNKIACSCKYNVPV